LASFSAKSRTSRLGGSDDSVGGLGSSASVEYRWSAADGDVEGRRRVIVFGGCERGIAASGDRRVCVGLDLVGPKGARGD
jgi:hypothetical protein